MNWHTHALHTRTPHGNWYIRFHQGRFHPVFEDEWLGSYATAVQALEDLAGGSTFWPSCGDPSECGLSEEVSDWSVVRLR